MKKIEIILLHIKEDCCDIQKFIKDATKEQFLESALIKKAVCMSLINIGELVKSLPKNFCDANPQLPWRRIAGMRDIAAHKYKPFDIFHPDRGAFYFSGLALFELRSNLLPKLWADDDS
jgi:uncharacterized protein with HEPN domain